MTTTGSQPLELRDYGDNRHLVAHVAVDHPALALLKARCCWLATYSDLKQKGRLVAYDLAFQYAGWQDRHRLKQELTALAESIQTEVNQC